MVAAISSGDIAIDCSLDDTYLLLRVAISQCKRELHS